MIANEALKPWLPTSIQQPSADCHLRLFADLLPTTKCIAVWIAATVIDGDTIKIDGQRIRIHGIDAPEQKQSCTDTNGEEWPCGSVATAFMSHLVANHTVACEQRDVDRYGRIVAVCHAGGTDVGRAMVYYGLALAYRRYSKEYVATENGAREARRGMWQGKFVEPWAWRKAQRPSDD